MVADINEGSKGSDPTGLIALNDILYFAASDGNTDNVLDHGTELWRSDGTDSGTWMVKDINEGKQSSDPENFAVMDNILYFAASDGNTDNVLDHGTELWRSDGTDGNTWMVKDINEGKQSSDPGNLIVMGSVLYFSASDGDTDDVLDHGTECVGVAAEQMRIPGW